MCIRDSGNIISIKDSAGESTFRYDELNQLIRENNHQLNKTITYAYDLGGNLTVEKEYAFTTTETPVSYTHLRCRVKGMRMKEDMVLLRKEAAKSYTYLYQTEGLVPDLREKDVYKRQIYKRRN